MCMRVDSIVDKCVYFIGWGLYLEMDSINPISRLLTFQKYATIGNKWLRRLFISNVSARQGGPPENQGDMQCDIIVLQVEVKNTVHVL